MGASGLTTTPVAAGALVFELLLELTSHRLVLFTNQGERWSHPLRGQPVRELYAALQPELRRLGVVADVDISQLETGQLGEYDQAAVERYWQTLSRLDSIFKEFKGGLNRWTGPVQLWPHHLDLAVLWFSGRLVPGTDPEDEEYSDEQMNFGFSSGDSGTPDPYFYVTAYPFPEGLLDISLPPGAVWNTEGWRGALMMYQTLVEADRPRELLLDFLRTVQSAGAERMR